MIYTLSIFVAGACLILAAARLAGWLFQRFNQPRIIGEMVAGVLLGPSFLGWLAPEFIAAVFPPRNVDFFKGLSQLGLVLYMFMIGLKLDTKSLSERKHAAVLTSHSSIICPFILGLLLALYLGPELSKGDVPPVTFGLFMATAMSITAFPVLARILSERGMLSTKIGTIAIACAAVDDVTAWFLLTTVTVYTQTSNAHSWPWPTLLGLSLYFGLMWFAVRPGLHRLLDRQSAQRGLVRGLLAVVLLLPLSAVATEWLGVHALFGAFFAGLIMPRHEGLTRALSEKVEPAVVSLLLPIFFVLSGLRTSVSLVSGAEMWFYCGLILLVAVTGKLGGSMLSARLTGMSWREAGAIGVLMNTRGLMELVVLNIGLELGLISNAVFSMMVIMAVITTLMTSPLLALIYPKRFYEEEADGALRVRRVDRLHAPTSPAEV